MIDSMQFTLAQFLDELQEGERWIELSAGRLVRHDPPDVAHGNVVRNLSRALAVHIRQRPETVACFELGLVMSRNPDTVLCPAVSCFPLPAGFAEADKLISESVPRLVMEVASTNDRRTDLAQRVQGYLAHGIVGVWVFDPAAREGHVFSRSEAARRYRESETLHDAHGLPGFALPVAEVFADPAWWSANPQR